MISESPHRFQTRRRQREAGHVSVAASSTVEEAHRGVAQEQSYSGGPPAHRDATQQGCLGRIVLRVEDAK
jgi:hypothetical protein